MSASEHLSPSEYNGPLQSGCDVWLAPISVLQPWHDTLLDGVERDRAMRYLHDDDRARFVIGVAMTRLILGDVLGIDPVTVSLDRACRDCGQPHGAPVVLNEGEGALPHSLSLSHSGEWVLLAMARGFGVGVDIERVIERPDDRHIAERNFTAAECQAIAEYPSWSEGFYRHWTAKESALKAVNKGVDALSEVSLPPPSAQSGPVHYHYMNFIPAILHRFDAPPGYVAAVTTLTTQNVSLRTLRADTRLVRI